MKDQVRILRNRYFYKESIVVSMKRFYTLLAILVTGSASFAQISADIPAKTDLYDQLRFENFDEVVLNQVDNASALEEAEKIEAESGFYRFSKHIPVSLNLGNSGTWTEVPGGMLWRLKIRSVNALGTVLYYDKFTIPAGGYMHIYNEDRTDKIGAFTVNNNPEGGKYATGLIKGEAVILEYFEPSDKIGKGEISLETVSHAFRGADLVENERGSSQDCQVDINCPEGDNWRDQQRGIVRIIVQSFGGSGFCSGSLVNNTGEDCAPYVLSAFHCGTSSNTNHFNQYIFYFNYAFNGCGSGLISSGSITGCAKLADSGDGGGNNGSDFMLMELNQLIPWNYNPYFNGWNASGATPQSGVSIHHPSGDKMKISTYTLNLVNTTWGGASGSHWRVIWAGTANGHGVTEGGSSGSPIFDENGYIVGQLTGGSSYCNSVQPGGQTSPDFYGKMSYNWSSNPGDNLEDFLDPAGTGDQTFDGSNLPCPNYTDVTDRILSEDLTIFPNPSEGQFTVEVSFIMDDLYMEIFDAAGKLVYEKDLAGYLRANIDLTDQQSGLYMVRVRSGNKVRTERIIIR